MATRIDTSLQPSNSTDALWRAWVQFIEDTLVTTGGWVVTADTGQMTIASSAHPTTTNTKVGYRIYRMADSLQATAPVFMRVDYGSSSAANAPGIWLTIGQGSDGAGTITSIRLNGGAVSTPTVSGTNNSAATTANSYGCASTGHVAVAMFIDTLSAQRILTFSLERTRDADGTLNGNGLILMNTDPSSTGSSLSTQRYIILGSGAQPPTEKGILYILSTANPSAFGSDVGIGIPIPMKGVAQPPGLGYVVTRVSDFVAEAQFAVTLYGVSHNYVNLNLLNVGNPNGSTGVQDTTARPAMRYE